MTTRILVAKYVEDLRRWEPRNVGVIVEAKDGYAARFVGERPDGGVDGRKVRWNIDPEIYRGWIAFWKECLDKGDDGLAEAVRLSSSNYLLSAAAEVWIGAENVTAAELLARYYPELVERAEAEETADVAEPKLQTMADIVLEKAGATRLPSFRQGFQLEGTLDLREPEPYRFHYGWQNGHTIVAHRVPLSDQERVDAVLWRFAHLPSECDSVALIRGDATAGMGANLRGQLRDRATLVVDVDEDDAHLQVRELLAS
jgi:hypothetical protein